MFTLEESALLRRMIHTMWWIGLCFLVALGVYLLLR